MQFDNKNKNIQESSVVVSDYNEGDTLDTQNRISGGQVVSQDLVEPKKTNPYIDAKRLWMMPCISTVLFGAYFNAQFQSFIKEQLMDSMNMSSNDYSWFVLIPTLPNIPLPLFIGPMLDSIGAHRGMLLFTFMVSFGMAMCMIAISIDSFMMLIIGKTVLQIAVECQGIAHGCIAGKWFSAKGLASIFTLTSLFCKIASSTSGIIYPQLYNINDSLMTPLYLGISLCIITLFVAIAIFILDSNSLKYEPVHSNDEQIVQQKKKFKLSDFKKFDKMFWFYAALCPLMFGAFYAFENYLQSILMHKFMIEKTLAGELVSVPYWIAFSTPIFGFLADKFGMRCIFLNITTFLSFVSALILYILPTGENNGIVYTALIIFGIFLSAMCAFLYPTVPLLSKKELLSTGFAICYATKNGGTALLNYISGQVIGSDDLGYNSVLLTYVIMFLIAVAISITVYLYDRKHGSIINSKTPQRYIEYVIVKRQKRASNQITAALL